MQKLEADFEVAGGNSERGTGQTQKRKKKKKKRRQ
jgi:hypothetical protein